MFLGHAATAVNIPLAFLGRQWQIDKLKCGFEMNPDLIDHVDGVFRPADTVAAMRCSGGGNGLFAHNSPQQRSFGSCRQPNKNRSLVCVVWTLVY